jgi:hypothetical protein
VREIDIVFLVVRMHAVRVASRACGWGWSKMAAYAVAIVQIFEGIRVAAVEKQQGKDR